MNWLLEKYYGFLLKHEKMLDVLRDKTLEFIIKFPVWFIIQLVFWAIGKHFWPGVHFYSSVYDVFSHFLSKKISYLVQVSVYYIIINPYLEALVIILGSRRNRKRK